MSWGFVVVNFVVVIFGFLECDVIVGYRWVGYLVIG